MKIFIDMDGTVLDNFQNTTGTPTLEEALVQYAQAPNYRFNRLVQLYDLDQQLDLGINIYFLTKSIAREWDLVHQMCWAAKSKWAADNGAGDIRILCIPYNEKKSKVISSLNIDEEEDVWFVDDNFDELDDVRRNCDGVKCLTPSQFDLMYFPLVNRKTA